MKPSVQWLRHSVQFAVLLAIIAVPVLAQYRVLLARNQIESVRVQETRSLQRAVMLEVDRVLWAGQTDAPATKIAIVDTLGQVQGNHWSARVSGVSWTDPLAAFESMSAGRKVTVTVLAGLSLPVVLTLVFGRVFCSWICPAGFLFDLADKIRVWFPGSKKRRDVAFWRGNKYVLLAVGLGLSFLVGAPLLGLFYPPALIGREIGHVVQSLFAGLSGDSSYVGWIALTGASVFLVLLVFVEMFVSRRMWCRYLCPGGAVYSLLGRKRVVGLRNTSACTGCADCIQACPMGLNPMKNQFGQECDLCLECQTACRPGAIHFQHPFSRTAKAIKNRNHA